MWVRHLWKTVLGPAELYHKSRIWWCRFGPYKPWFPLKWTRLSFQCQAPWTQTVKSNLAYCGYLPHRKSISVNQFVPNPSHWFMFQDGKPHNIPDITLILLWECYEMRNIVHSRAIDHNGAKTVSENSVGEVCMFTITLHLLKIFLDSCITKCIYLFIIFYLKWISHCCMSASAKRDWSRTKPNPKNSSAMFIYLFCFIW